MKPVFTAISAVLVAGALGLGTAQALPRIDGVAAGATSDASANVEEARVVCNYRRCFRTGGFYRPYYGGYYRPYYRGYYRPGIGIGIGPFGVGVY